MPFQDIEEDATSVPRPPSAPERWTRKILLEDWGLKLLAAAITVVLWLAVTGQNKPVTMRVSGVQLNFLKRQGLEISNELPSSVEVILTGSPGKLDRIGPRPLVATVDVSDQKAGERVIRLSLDRVNIDLPDGVKVQGFQPTTIPIHLEPSVEAQVEVDVKFEGKLPEGYELRGFSTSPARVRLRGPSDRVNALSKATTETVSLDGKTESFTVSNVSISIPDPRIDVLDPTVDVRVEIGEKKRGEAHLRFVNGDALPYLAGIVVPAHRH